ncbi:MAG: DNA methylase [Phycisphaerae bacterium SM23_30]|nr:MAG: DNA methylase [Phycisphaerae bacterium SM23_30]
MKRKIIPYKPRLKELARQLRNNSTLAEVLMWQELKGKKMRGYDFHRQKPIDEYIVDFFCAKLMLAIEIDGLSHEIPEKFSKDARRQKRLESLGIRFLRFHDLEVKKDMTYVLRAIDNFIDQCENEEFKEHTPNPSQEGN